MTAARKLAEVFLLFVFVFSPTPGATSCAPLFPYVDGWLGGDRAYSIRLDSERDLWLFGDSFIAAGEPGSRRQSTMVANVPAISSCAGGNWTIHYYQAGTRTNPKPLFGADVAGRRLWPLDGILYDGKLWLFFVEIATGGSGPFNFTQTGAKLAMISNPTATPDRWQVSYRDLRVPTGVVPGASVFIKDRFAYFYTVADRPAAKREVILGRVPLDYLDSPAAHVEFLGKRGGWKRELNPRDAEIIMDNAAPEFSIRYHADLSRWLMVETDPGFPPTQIGIRSASRPEGPWSDFIPLYHIPDARFANVDSVFCYEAREHPELAPSHDSLLVTYVCSSLSFARQIEESNLYRPHVILLPLPR